MAKILVIDDEKDIAELIKLVLELNQYEVILETDPEMAVEQIKNHHPDLILLDVVMPKMDGYDVLKEIRKVPAFSKIPIAFLTSKNKSVDFMVGLHMMKVDDYITKPFGKKDLLSRVETLLSKNQPAQGG